MSFAFFAAEEFVFQLAAGDAILDQPTQLDAERYRQVTVDAQIHPVPDQFVSLD